MRFSRGLGLVVVVAMGCDDEGSSSSASSTTAGSTTSSAQTGSGGGAGGSGIGGATSSSGGATSSSGGSEPMGFVHPGILLGEKQIDFVKAKVAANEQPWRNAFDKMKASRFGKAVYVEHPADHLSRNEYAAGQSTSNDLRDDAVAAYTNALIYEYTGDAAYAQQSIRILNAWAHALKTVDGDPDSPGFAQLDAAWVSEMLPRAAELIRYTYTPSAGDDALDITAVTSLFKDVLLPQLDPTSPGATFSNGNWELSMADGTVNIGVFTDDNAVFEQGLAMWRARVPAYIYQSSDGAVPVYPPGGKYESDALVTCFWVTGGQHTTTCTVPAQFEFQDGLAQESCRDMSHVVFAFEAMTNAAETARLQKVDLYGEEQTRIVEAYEFAAKHDLEALASPIDGTKGTVSDASICNGTFNYGGEGYKPGWEIAYNHFHGRLGVSMPSTLAMIQKLRPTPATLHMAWETLTSAEVP